VSASDNFVMLASTANLLKAQMKSRYYRPLNQRKKVAKNKTAAHIQVVVVKSYQ